MNSFFRITTVSALANGVDRTATKAAAITPSRRLQLVNLVVFMSTPFDGSPRLTQAPATARELLSGPSATSQKPLPTKKPRPSRQSLAPSPVAGGAPAELDVNIPL